jgi:hypothetical protein
MLPDSIYSNISSTKQVMLCPLCGHAHRTYLYTIHGLRIESCDNCGLYFQDNNNTRQQPLNSYSLENSETERKAAINYLDILKSHQLDGQSVLLVAPNQHPFLSEATSEGYKVDVISEIDEVYVQENAYDAIVVIYSLGAATNPISTLNKIYEGLKPNGLLVLLASVLDSWPARFFKRSWIGWNAGNHCYFDTQIIQSMLLGTGFADIVIRPDRRYYSLSHIYNRAFTSPKTWLTRSIILGGRLIPSKFRSSRAMFRLSTSGVMVCARRVEKRNRPLLSIVMPVYNERATVEETLQLVLDKQVEGIDKEVIIVESNSTDGTRDVVRQYQDHPEVRLILEDRPRGKGRAVRTGLENARGDFILIQDADREYDVDDYDVLVEPLKTYRCAFVLGSRHIGGKKMREFSSQPFLSNFYNFGHSIFCGLLNLLYRQQLKDPFTMYKVFRRDCLYGLHFECNRFDFDFELVIKLLRKGYVPIEIPVNYSARSFAEGKKVSTFRDPITWLRALVKFRFAPIYNRHYSD